jgi:hypothetical protein
MEKDKRRNNDILNLLFIDHCLSFCPFPFSIVLSVLRFTALITSSVNRRTDNTMEKGKGQKDKQ